MRIVAHMPLTGHAQGITVFCQDLGIGEVAVKKAPRFGAVAVFVEQIVLDAVLGGH